MGLYGFCRVQPTGTFGGRSPGYMCFCGFSGDTVVAEARVVAGSLQCVCVCVQLGDGFLSLPDAQLQFGVFGSGR